MECFIKKIFLNNADLQAHHQFVRFGKGDYKGRAVLTLWKTSKLKLSGSFEYANDFVNFLAGFPAKFSGIILSREKLDLENENKKSGLFVYEVNDLASEKVKEISEKAYFLLLDAVGEGISLKIKKKLPKLGKSGESKIDDKFCIIEADLGFYEKIKDAFFWDVPNCKKVKASHEYKITELVMPKDEKDFEKIRILTKRKGLLIRKLEVDGRQEIKEKEFEV